MIKQKQILKINSYSRPFRDLGSVNTKPRSQLCQQKPMCSVNHDIIIRIEMSKDVKTVEVLVLQNQLDNRSNPN